MGNRTCFPIVSTRVHPRYIIGPCCYFFVFCFCLFWLPAFNVLCSMFPEPGMSTLNLVYLITYQNTSLAYRVYLSHLIRYSTACSNYQFLLHRRLYLSNKLVILKPSLQMFFIMHRSTIIIEFCLFNFGCYVWSRRNLN